MKMILNFLDNPKCFQTMFLYYLEYFQTISKMLSESKAFSDSLEYLHTKITDYQHSRTMPDDVEHSHKCFQVKKALIRHCCIYNKIFLLLQKL